MTITPADTPPPREWNADEDAFLVKLMRSSIPHQTIADRLGRTVIECRERHQHLEQVAKAAKPADAAGSAPEEPGVAEPERPMDQLQIVLLDFCKKYNELGQQLEIFSTFISQSLSWEDLQKHVVEIEAFRKQCVSPLPPNEFLALMLHQRFILVPRPLLVPQAPKPEEDEEDPIADKL